MPRVVKTFSTIAPKSLERAKPVDNAIKIDLGGLKLSEDQIAKVRQNAVAAALTQVESLVDAADYDSFSTFSTFSTFSSGSAGRLAADLGGDLVNRVLINR